MISMIAIIDYGMGNIHSVNKALQLYGAKTIVTNSPKDIELCDKVVLPGVGAFADAMSELEKRDLVAHLIAHIKNKKPFLGICLGMQLLFKESQEARGCRGLGVFKGMVRRFTENKSLKVPHIGWNQLEETKGDCPILKGIPDNPYVYFCHSYYPEPSDKNIIAAVTDYGFNFGSVLWQDNIYGVQFHPEKSQAVGLKILENFLLC